MPLSLKLVALTCLLPEGMSFFIAGLRFNPIRVIFLVLTPVVFIRLAQKMATGRYRFVLSDLLVPAAAFWMFLGPSVVYGFDEALVHAGPVVLEYLIAYMCTRVLLESDGQAQDFVGFLCIVIAFVCLDAFLDTLTGQYFTRNLVSVITGYQKDWHAADEFRFGLLRAAGPIEHPIAFGLIAGIGLQLSVWTNIRYRRFCIAACALGIVICLSSAPEQGVIMCFGLMIYGRIMGGMRAKWLLLIGGIAAAAAALCMASNRPLGFIFDIATIDPSTAYFREYVWTLVGPVVLEYPYFGVPLDNLEYQGSIDSLWLVLAVLYGMPCSILTGLSMLGACWLPTDAARASLTDDETKVGTILGILMAIIIFIGFTVHLWGSAWILVGILTGLRAQLGELGALNRRALMSGRGR